MSKLSPSDSFERSLYELGRLEERNQIIELMNSRICFRFMQGDCDHGSCWELFNMLQELNKK